MGAAIVQSCRDTHHRPLLSVQGVESRRGDPLLARRPGERKRGTPRHSARIPRVRPAARRAPQPIRPKSRAGRSLGRDLERRIRLPGADTVGGERFAASHSDHQARPRVRRPSRARGPRSCIQRVWLVPQVPAPLSLMCPCHKGAGPFPHRTAVAALQTTASQPTSVGDGYARSCSSHSGT
jgi:hypothetical protein